MTNDDEKAKLKIEIATAARRAGGRGTTAKEIVATLSLPLPSDQTFTEAFDELLKEKLIVMQQSDLRVFDAERWGLLNTHRAMGAKAQQVRWRK